MQLPKFASILAAVAVVGCGGGDKVDMQDASVKDVAEATRNAVKMQPGQWRTTVKIDEFSIPGAPPQMQDMMKAQMAKGQSFDYCLTPEQAEKPAAEMLTGRGADACTYDRFSMDGGKVSAVMTCKSGPGAPGTMKMTMDGSYAPTAMNVNVSSEMKGMMPGGAVVTMKGSNSSTRIGECTKG